MRDEVFKGIKPQERLDEEMQGLLKSYVKEGQFITERLEVVDDLSGILLESSLSWHNCEEHVLGIFVEKEAGAEAVSGLW